MTTIFQPDTSEAATFDLVEAGQYRLMIHGSPKIRLSQKDQTPYLAWQFVHTGENAGKGSMIFENTMLAGKGSGRLISLFGALGYNEEAVKTLRVKPTAELGPANAKEGVPTELTLNGAPFQPEGMEFDAVVRVEDDGVHTARNGIGRYMKKAA